MKVVKKLLFTALRLITLLIGVSIISFMLVTNAPIDPIDAYIGPEKTISQEARESIIEHWGLNEPAYKRFITWGRNTLKGDLGMSITYKKPVIDVIGERFKYSFPLMISAWILSGILGFLLGVLAGTFNGGKIDKVIKSLSLISQSAPTFWIGLIMLSLFSITLGWFPIGFSAPIGALADNITIGDRLYHLVLPVLTLSIVNSGRIILLTRQKLIEILNMDFINYARVRGENEFQIVMRHGIRNIAIPAITDHFTSFSELFGGIVLAETVFSYPGLGSATIAAGMNGDVQLLLGIAVFTAIFVFIGNLLSNIITEIIDPRIRVVKNV